MKSSPIGEPGAAPPSLAGPFVASPQCPALVQSAEGAWRLLRGGEPGLVHGAGGAGRLGFLASLGATTLRTWHTTDASDLDQAHAHGLDVMAGLTVAHERHGFNYADRAAVLAQRERILDLVRQLKNHPALLLWGLGNEAEGFERPDGSPAVWRELEILTRLIKEEDPFHPVCTVIAGPGEEKLAAFDRHCPSVDILGINAYGGAPLIPDAIVRAGISRPYLLTEFGPTGHWESPATPWGAPIEPPAREKARTYLVTHREMMARGQGRCLGTFAFLWGQKQEVTATWYGMFLPTGERTPAVDAMTLAWTGRPPARPCPQLHALHSHLDGVVVAPGRTFEAEADFGPAAPSDLSLDWLVVAESSDRRIGGDPEAAPPEIPGCILATHNGRATVRTPDTPGPYRLFLYARDGHGGGTTGNLPFHVGPRPG
ncbi:MAG: hypothetical protein EA425_04210 [Puniceicoccaceae bacterium]|nr:MAG: hypothetical protein EA425_04210 [Puniceicoccaceae bacterium]